MSPSINEGPFKLTVHTGNEDPPPHVHVGFEGREVRINLYDLKPLDDPRSRVPRQLMEAVKKHREELIEWWDKFQPPRRDRQ